MANYENPGVWDYFMPEAGEKAKSDAELREQIKTLTSQVDALTRAPPRVQAFKMPEAPQPPQEVPLDMKGLPDPLVDAEAYGTELVRRTRENETLNRRIAADFNQRMEAYEGQQEAVVNGLWEGFKDRYPAFKGVDMEKVEYAGTTVVAAAKAKGIDLDAYVFTDPTQFYADLEVEVKKVLPADFGKIAEEGEEIEMTNDSLGKLRSEALRTIGVFGGDGDGKGGPKKPGPADAGDMIKEMQEFQIRTGFF